MPDPAIRTCLWFAQGAEEAAARYVALVPGSGIDAVFPARGDPQGRAFLVHLTLAGQRFSFMNGGPHFQLSPALSIEVHLDSQDEVDALWEALLEGGTAQRCGWLTDRWGVSWQIIPRALIRLMASPDDAVAARVTQAMMGMIKLDAAALEAAAHGAE